MLKIAARGQKGGKPVKLVVLGLSHANLARLKEGQPISFDGAEVNLPGVEVMIFAGETEQMMVRDVADLVGPNTVTKINPRLRN